MTIIDRLPGFSWGLVETTPVFKEELQHEFSDNTPYEKYFSVQMNDVVLDVGANIGLFSLSIADKKPSIVYTFEPQKEIFSTLESNINNLKRFIPNFNCVTINKAINSSNGKFMSLGLFDPSTTEIREKENEADGLKFKDFLHENQIKHIDFLKLDCEGGEWDILNEENKDFILDNVFKISGELHFGPEFKENFVWFRDNILAKCKNYWVEAVDGTDIKWWVFDPSFYDFYSRIYIHIDNRRAKDRFVFKENFSLINHKGKKEWWRLTDIPTLEFTTSIPRKGCVVDCAFCPQRTLQNKYKGEQYLSLENFKKIIDKLPKEIRITFSGFVEPWMNKWTTDMVLYAYEKGHDIAIFTTGVGWTLDDVERIKDIQFNKQEKENGGFCLHLPDAELIAKHPITNNLISVYKRFKELENDIKGFYTMSMSEVHPVVKDIFPNPEIPEFWSRAGNLLGEAIIKPELQKWMTRVKHAVVGDNMSTCNCIEELYHNVVLPNGDVVLCCMDYDLKHILGNILEQDYEDVIPAPFQCFTLCNTCENGTPQSTKKIRKSI